MHVPLISRHIPLRRTAWLEAAWIFIVSRLLILFITVVATGRNFPPGQPIGLSWLHWDVGNYIDIAQHGYSNLKMTVFFPLWPLLIHSVGTLFGASTMSYSMAALLLANLLFYFALVIFYRLLNDSFDPIVARKSLCYLAFSPYAIFFFVGYTESLFLLLCLAAFLCLQCSHYWLAGLCGFLAALTHAQGILLVVPVAIIMLQRFWLRSDERMSWQRRLSICLSLLLIPLGVVAFMLYLGITKGSPLAFSAAEPQLWNRHLTFPLVSIIMTLQTFFHPETAVQHLLNLLDIIFVLVPFAILIIGWKRLPLHYALFALAMMLFNVSYPQGAIEPLTAVPRYMLVVFPIFIILGGWGKSPYLDRIITVCSTSLFMLNALLFVVGYWVA
jgi:hypothetical protein